VGVEHPPSLIDPGQRRKITLTPTSCQGTTTITAPRPTLTSHARGPETARLGLSVLSTTVLHKGIVFLLLVCTTVLFGTGCPLAGPVS